MPGKGVGEEVMPKNLQSEKRAFDKRAVAREKVIVQRNSPESDGVRTAMLMTRSRSARNQFLPSN
jgi:hypothetical protein